MSILSPVARAAAIAAGTQEAHRRANAGTTTSLSEHVRGIVEAALDAAVAAEHCPYPGCIVVHRDHSGSHVVTSLPPLEIPRRLCDPEVQ